MHANPNARLPIVEPDIIPVNSQVTVTIGRNIGAYPMSEDWWNDFQTFVRQFIRESLHISNLFTYKGTGEWDGVTEDSIIYVAIGNQYPASTKEFARVLGNIAREFSQDAIAWSFGPNNLAKGN